MSPAARPALLMVPTGLLAFVVGLPLVLVGITGPPADSPSDTARLCTSSSAPAGPIALDAEQIANATTIVSVGHYRDLPRQAIVIALATAMQESSLRNLSHGDLAGPTSRGLFQQQPRFYPDVNVTDPAAAAGAFYDRLIHVPGWQEMPIWQAAQAVQRSAYPAKYARWQPLATTLAATLDNQPDARIRCTESTPVGAPDNVRLAAAVGAARSQLGQPYVWGGGNADGPTAGVDNTTPPGYDCSGLMTYAWAHAGVTLPHSSRLQYGTGAHIPVGQARAGDMIFLGTDPTNPDTIHHVALVIAPDQIIEAQTFGVPVHVRAFAGPAEPEIMPFAVRLVA